ncbi:7495_t:CDS:2 [Dentiscutata erythropus]|uniref:7495_t:CDS:1 n=1 Tax=Dentiscutata erythropus TaxID=1348616 RepID=A0A9N9ICR0_9GLOM|nr:7495_t:CDS:2 [Dentiscutata erythropus]
MDDFDDYENEIYDHRVYDDEMDIFENNNYNGEVIAPNDSISVLSVSESLITNSSANPSTNLNTNSNTTNSSTNSSVNLNTTNLSVTINTTETSSETATSRNRSPVWENFSILESDQKAKFMDELSFQFIEKQGFQKFVNGVLPGFTISADTIKHDIMKTYNKIKALLQTITLDNVASNDVAVRELTNNILQELIDIKNEIFHNCCLAHILNLIVKDELKKISEKIKMIRSCIKAIHTSPKRRQMFIDTCEYESLRSIILLLDCETRWNSTFMILQLAIKLKAAIIRVKDRDKAFLDVPNEEEWEKAKAICILNALANFYSTINHTLLSILDIHTHIFKMKSHSDIFIRKVSLSMIEKFNKYWENGNLLCMIAYILDPRYKLQFISFYYHKKEEQEPDYVDEKVQDIRTSFKDIYLNYYSPSVLEQSPTNTENATSIKNNALLYEDYIDDYYEYVMKKTD